MVAPVMRALVHDRYGSPEHLRLEQVPQPQPGPGEVLVQVRAAALNAWDWDLLTGTSMGRLGSPFRPAHKILGADVAGIVAGLGDGTTGLKIGDAVFGDLSETNWGALAQFAIAKASDLALIPKDFSFRDAAALPQAGALALQGLRLRSTLGAGESILINGAGGGVGTFAVQMAKTLGVHVTAVDRGEKREGLHALGADQFFDYRETDFTRHGERYDLVLDLVGRHTAKAYSRVLKPGGNLALVGGKMRSILSVAAFGSRAGKVDGQNLELLVYRVSAEDCAELARRCIEGTLRPIIDTVFPLEQGREAFRRLGSGLAFGKVVVAMEV